MLWAIASVTGILINEGVEAIAFGSLIWAAGSFSVYCHLRDHIAGKRYFNSDNYYFNFPYIDLASNEYWKKRTRYMFGRSGLKIAALLLVSLVPLVWTYLNVLFP